MALCPPFGPIWHVGLVGPVFYVWSFLALFGLDWPRLTPSGAIWPQLTCLAMFGHIWPRLTPIGPFSPSLSCLVYNFLKIFCKRNINVLNLNLSKLLDQSVLSKNLSLYLDKKNYLIYQHLFGAKRVLDQNSLDL